MLQSFSQSPDHYANVRQINIFFNENQNQSDRQSHENIVSVIEDLLFGRFSLKQETKDNKDSSAVTEDPL